MGVAEGDDGDVGVTGFLDGFGIGMGVDDDEEFGLLELLGLVVGEGSGSPLGGGGHGAVGVGGEFDDGSLTGLSGGDSVHVLEVGDSGDDSGGQENSLVGLVQVENGNSRSVEGADESLHLYVVVLRPQVAVGVQES